MRGGAGPHGFIGREDPAVRTGSDAPVPAPGAAVSSRSNEDEHKKKSAVLAFMVCPRTPRQEWSNACLPCTWITSMSR